jgi:hypothetical protein
MANPACIKKIMAAAKINNHSLASLAICACDSSKALDIHCNGKASREQNSKIDSPLRFAVIVDIEGSTRCKERTTKDDDADADAAEDETKKSSSEVVKRLEIMIRKNSRGGRIEGVQKTDRFLVERRTIQRCNRGQVLVAQQELWAPSLPLE